MSKNPFRRPILLCSPAILAAGVLSLIAYGQSAGPARGPATPEKGTPGIAAGATNRTMAHRGSPAKQQFAETARVLLYENFSDGLAEGWEITDGNVDGVTWGRVTVVDARDSEDGFGILDSDFNCSPPQTFDEYLTSPPLAIESSAPLQINIRFQSDYSESFRLEFKKNDGAWEPMADLHAPYSTVELTMELNESVSATDLIQFRLAIVAADYFYHAAVFDFSVLQGAVSADAYEDDGTLQQATPLSLDAPQLHSLYPPGDVDWYAFTLEDAVSITVDTGIYLDYDVSPLELVLYDRQGQSLQYGYGILRCTLAPGDYFLQVIPSEFSRVRDRLIFPDYAITLTVDPDPFEPDPLEQDYSSQSGLLTQALVEGQTYTRYMSPWNNDRDYFILSLSESREITLQFDDVPPMSGALSKLDLESFESLNVAFFSGEENTSPSLEAALPPGMYLLELYSYGSGFSTAYAPYSLTFSSVPLSVTLDEYEPNGLQDQSTLLDLGQPLEATIHTSDDEDWFAFSLDADSRVYIALAGINTRALIFLADDPDGYSIASIVANEADPETIVLPAGGYRILVNEQDGYTFSQIGVYTISVFSEPFPIADDPWEPNDHPETAVPLATGEPQEHLFASWLDSADVFSIEIAEPSDLLVEILPDANAGIYVYIANENSGYNYGSYYSGCDIAVFRRTVPPGLYFLYIYDYTNQPFTYTITAQLLEPSVRIGDAYEPDNSPLEATLLEVDSSQPHTLAPRTDEDWYYIQIQTPTSVMLAIDAPYYDAQISLYDTAENLIAEGEIVDEEPYSSQLNTVLSPGLYFARVYHNPDYYAEASLEYTISYSAQPVTISTDPLQLHGEDGIEVPADTSAIVYTFVLDEALTLYFGATPGMGSGTLSLYNEYGQQQSSGSGLLATAGPGTYYLIVERDSSDGPFEFFVLPLEADGFESDNSPESATPLASGSAHGPHTLAPDGDVDWFTFTLETASTVTLDTLGAENGLWLTVYDADANEVASGVRVQIFLETGVYYVQVALPRVLRTVPVYELMLRVSAGVPVAPTYRFQRLTPTLQQPWYFTTPADVEVAASNDVYLTDSFGHRVFRLTANGQLLHSWGQQGVGPGEFRYPSGIAVGLDGGVYVADTDNNRIQQFTSAGVYVAEWGERGTSDGEFLFNQFEFDPSNGSTFIPPVGLATGPNGRIYVCDIGNSRVQVFDAGGSFVFAWGVAYPSAVTVSLENEVYVADTLLEKLTIFDSDGEKREEFSTLGTPFDKYDGPSGIALRQDGAIAVSHAGNTIRDVVVFSRTGEILERIQTRNADVSIVDLRGTPQPAGLTYGAQGELYIANVGVEKLDAEGTRLNLWQSHGDREGSFLIPSDLAVDDSGNAFVLDALNNRIQRTLPSGESHIIINVGESGNTPTYGTIVEVDGNALYTSNGYSVTVSDLDGNTLRELVLPPSHYIQDIATDLDGTLIATLNGDAIVRYDSSFNQLDSWSIEFPDGDYINYGLTIAVGPEGTIYLPISSLNVVQRYSASGELLSEWGEFGDGPGQLNFPLNVAVDRGGFVYVSDTLNDRIQRFTPDGSFVDIVVPPGDGPGFCRAPGGIDFGPDGTLYFAELGNNRVQSLKPVQVTSNARAIVVAAGGPFPGNQLWDTTQFCANFAMRALAHQGFRNEDIYYLSSDLDLDLDNNGLPDDVDGDVTNANLAGALTEWTAGADSLVIYLVDHGGSDTFRMSQNEVLSAANLGAWLDEADGGISGRITVIYDACQSGSFLEELEGPNRIVITSSDAEESAYFLSTGTISFSNFFWTHVFNGFSVADAFAVATDAIGQSIGFQTPQLRDPNNLAATTFIGNGTEIIGDAPRIVAATSNQPLTGAAGLDLFAEMEDEDGISRAWAVVRPPNFAPPSPDNPVQNLPVIELQPVGQGAARWEGRFDGFTHEGVYRLSFYCRDSIGNTSLPLLRTITVGDPMFRRAVLLGGGAGRDITTESVEESLRIAYNALVSQGYGADDIRIYAPTTFSTGGENPHPVELNVLENLDFALGEWLGDNTQDLLLYAVGDGGAGTLALNEGQVLTADGLAARLQGTQERISGVLAVMLDSPRSGSFLPALAAPAAPRIVIASAGADQDICLAPQRNISFSNYFWRRVLNGANVSESFTHAALAMSFAAMGQSAELDDDGDGAYDTATDGLLAGRYLIGSGILLAGDDPIIGQVSEPQMLDGEASAMIWADEVTTTGAIASVYAVVLLPPASVGAKAVTCGERPVDVVELTNANGRYEGEYRGLYFEGKYDINIVAIDDDGAVSLPGQTHIVQMQSTEGPADPDAFEDDDTPGEASNLIVDGAAQAHNFHDAGDEDWAVFVVAAEQILTLRTERLGTAGDTLLELYADDGTTLLASNNDRGPQDPSSEVRHSVMEDGLLYVRVRHARGTFGAGTDYDLRAFREAGPESPGAIGGTVMDATTDAPIRGLDVRLTAVDGSGQPALETTTGQGGEFLFLQLGTGNYSVSVLGNSEYMDAPPRTVELAAGALPLLTFEMVKKSPADDDGGPFRCNANRSASSGAPAQGSTADTALFGVMIGLLLLWRVTPISRQG